MKFKMNNREWEIREYTEEEMLKENINGEEGISFGMCDYQKQLIYLWKDLHQEQKRQTLIHELVHCYLGCYVSFEDMQWNDDVICNVVANSHDIIHKIVEDYFNEELNKEKEEHKRLEEENKRLEKDLERLKNNSLMAKVPKTYRNLEDFNVGDSISDFFKK